MGTGSHALLVDDLGLDQVGGAAFAQGDAGGDDHSVSVPDQPLLQSHLGGEGEDTVGGVDLPGEEGDDPPADGQLAADLLMHGEGGHRAGGTEAGDHAGGAAGVGGGQNGGGVQILGGQAAGVGDGVVDVGGGDHPLLLELAPVVDGALGLLHDAHPGAQGLHGVLAPGGLAGEHDAAGAVKDGVGHVGHLGPGGPGVAHHGVQHLGGGDHRLARLEALADDLLLEDGHPGGWDLHPQVAPGHHDAVGGGENLVDVVHALLILDLGDDAHVVPAEGPEDLPHRLDVGGPADEGGGDEVEVVLHGWKYRSRSNSNGSRTKRRNSRSSIYKQLQEAGRKPEADKDSNGR